MSLMCYPKQTEYSQESCVYTACVTRQSQRIDDRFVIYLRHMLAKLKVDADAKKS